MYERVKVGPGGYGAGAAGSGRQPDELPRAAVDLRQRLLPVWDGRQVLHRVGEGEAWEGSEAKGSDLAGDSEGGFWLEKQDFGEINTQGNQKIDVPAHGMEKNDFSFTHLV